MASISGPTEGRRTSGGGWRACESLGGGSARSHQEAKIKNTLPRPGETRLISGTPSQFLTRRQIKRSSPRRQAEKMGRSWAAQPGQALRGPSGRAGRRHAGVACTRAERAARLLPGVAGQWDNGVHCSTPLGVAAPSPHLPTADLREHPSSAWPWSLERRPDRHLRCSCSLDAYQLAAPRPPSLRMRWGPASRRRFGGSWIKH